MISSQVVLGTVLNEGSPLAEILARDGDGSDASMRAAIQELLTSCGVNDSSKLVDYYSSEAWPGQRGVNLSWTHRLLGDVFFECPVLSFANHLSARGNRVYVYRFDHKTKALEAKQGGMGGANKKRHAHLLILSTFPLH
ncbi:hypothetical protein HPB51_000155 [Rhipicephalus microplus]|uniref:Carboxylesterase type B domain-containing protein n=1 Tax=Rhipicephalus microplus TaxID=6941 RepID=A0A9J6EVK4_RHIMP|nr:hypothetical protein HPB51_000155 [Rhipicephalus microplus]